MAGYYDLVLGLIPLTLVGASATLVAAGLSLSVAVPIAGLLVVALIGHAMFVHTPGAPEAPTVSDGPGLEPAD